MESCACSERQIRDMSKDISKFAFPNELDKQQCHYDAVTKLGGMLLLILKTDPRQRQNDENYFAFGAYAQNLMLLLYEAGIGTCWKSPLYIYDPKVRKTLGIKKDGSCWILIFNGFRRRYA